jgi:hypothetical protein
LYERSSGDTGALLERSSIKTADFGTYETTAASLYQHAGLIFKWSMGHVMAEQPLVSVNQSRSPAVTRVRYATETNILKFHTAPNIASMNVQETPQFHRTHI